MLREDVPFLPDIVDFDPRSGDCAPLRWGIVGVGGQSVLVCEDLATIPSASVSAASGRTIGRVEAFAERFGIRRVHQDHRELAADPTVDVVYVAAPPENHFEIVHDCLRAGKHVVCEKPLAMDVARATELVELARSRSLFLMEALFSRFLPATQLVLGPVVDGSIGDVRWVHADLGFDFYSFPGGRWGLTLGGGALLETGPYTIGWAQLLFGAEAEVTANVERQPNGVDGMTAASFDYGHASVHTVSALDRDTPGSLVVGGTEGFVRIPEAMNNPTVIETLIEGRFIRRDVPRVGHGYAHELRVATDGINQGRGESTLMRLADSLELASLMERARMVGNAITLPA